MTQTCSLAGTPASRHWCWGEFALADLDAGILGASGQADYIPVWVCAVVGVHLLTLAPLLRDCRLVALGVLVPIVALAAPSPAWRTRSRPAP